MDLGGGWADTVLAHESMLHPLPDAIAERGASLYEPVSIACHGLMRARPDDGDPVLVVGAGIIGLAALAALRGLFPHSPVTVLARHPHQGAAATACGADHVVLGDPDNGHWEELAALSRVAGDRAQAPPDADGRVPLRRRGGRVTPVGHRGAARRRPPGHRAPARRGGHQRGRPHARSGTRRPPSSAPSTTPSTPRRRRDWPAGRAGTRSTGRSTSSPPACCPTRSW